MKALQWPGGQTSICEIELELKDGKAPAISLSLQEGSSGRFCEIRRAVESRARLLADGGADRPSRANR